MGLLSFLKRSSRSAAAGRNSVLPVVKDEPVERARTRARHRLIGAVVLLGVAVIGFPLLFETQPRPIPVDLPIEIPKKENARPLAPSRPSRAGEAASPSGRASSARGGESRSQGSEAVLLPAARRADLDASRTLEDRPGDEDSRAAEDLRFALQIGAFGEADSAREARTRVERLGLRTYLHEIETSGGRRIRVRVGPFATRDEADKAAARLRAAGLPVALLSQ